MLMFSRLAAYTWVIFYSGFDFNWKLRGYLIKKDWASKLLYPSKAGPKTPSITGHVKWVFDWWDTIKTPSFYTHELILIPSVRGIEGLMWGLLPLKPVFHDTLRSRWSYWQSVCCRPSYKALPNRAGHLLNLSVEWRAPKQKLSIQKLRDV